MFFLRQNRSEKSYLIKTKTLLLNTIETNRIPSVCISGIQKVLLDVRKNLPKVDLTELNQNEYLNNQ